MKKQRHNWLSYLIIFSLVLLPLQYGQAMSMGQMMSTPVSHSAAQQMTGAMQHGKHCQHADHAKTTNKVCDTEQNCCHHQCGKCQFGVLSTEINFSNKQQGQPLRVATSFSQFVTNPDLRPPKV